MSSYEVGLQKKENGAVRKHRKIPKSKTKMVIIMWSLIREGQGVLKNKQGSWFGAGQVPGSRNLKAKSQLL